MVIIVNEAIEKNLKYSIVGLDELDNELIDHVCREPGTCFYEIAGKIARSKSTLYYRVMQLERTGHLRVVRGRGMLKLYPPENMVIVKAGAIQ